MFFVSAIVVSLICSRATTGLLLTTENRVSSRNITCQHGSSSSSFVFNCEACLVTSRNYAIHTSLSLAGAGQSGMNYACLQASDIESYHENLVQECQNFPSEALNAYDDFCIAAPYSAQRGSYRACLCTTNACNFNYTECIRRANPYWDRKPPLFSNTIVRLTNRVKCYRPYEDNKQATTSSLRPLCASNDDECKNFLFDNGVLCAISVDRSNQVTRQTLPPSLYSGQIIKFKTVSCNSYTWTSKNIYFSKCQNDETICMCTVDGCDKDLETCRASRATYIHGYSLVYVLLLVCSIYQS